MYQAELDLYMETDEADYTKFSEGMATRRRQAADEAAPPSTRSIGKPRLDSAFRGFSFAINLSSHVVK